MLPVLPQILNGQLLDMIENKQLDPYLSEIWDATPNIAGDKPSESDTRNLRKKLVAHYETLNSDMRAAWQAPKLKLEDVVARIDNMPRLDDEAFLEKLRQLVPQGQVMDEEKIKAIIKQTGEETRAMMLQEWQQNAQAAAAAQQANNQQANNQAAPPVNNQQVNNPPVNNQQGNKDEKHGNPGFFKGIIDGLLNRSDKH